MSRKVSILTLLDIKRKLAVFTINGYKQMGRSRFFVEVHYLGCNRCRLPLGVKKSKKVCKDQELKQ